MVSFSDVYDAFQNFDEKSVSYCQIADILVHLSKFIQEKEAKSSVKEDQLAHLKLTNGKLKSSNESLKKEVQRLSKLLEEYDKNFDKGGETLIKKDVKEDAVSLFPRFQRSGARLNLSQTILAADTYRHALVSPPGLESSILNVTETQDKTSKDRKIEDERTPALPSCNNLRSMNLPKPVLSNNHKSSNCSKTLTARTDYLAKSHTSTHNLDTIDLDETCIPPAFINKDQVTPKADMTIDCSIPSSPVLTRSNHLRNERQRLVVKFNDGVNDGSPSLLTQPVNSSNLKNIGSKKNKIKSALTNDSSNKENSSEDLISAVENCKAIHDESYHISPIKTKSDKEAELTEEVDKTDFEDNEVPDDTWDEIFNKTEGALHTSYTEDNDKESCCSKEGDGKVVCSIDLTCENETTPDMECSKNIEQDQDHDDFVEERKRKRKAISNVPKKSDDSFHFVPKKQEPAYKYQTVERKRSERLKLEGKTCVQCEKFYSDIPEKERRKKINEVCRHRHKFVPPSTPECYWNLEFPSTAKCKRKGDGDQDDIKVKRKRRKQPLNLKLKAQEEGD